jgi:hypothetical protein
MTGRFSSVFTLLLAVPVLVLLLPLAWLIGGVIEAISRLAAQIRHGSGGRMGV